jgi:hypothetical protein
MMNNISFNPLRNRGCIPNGMHDSVGCNMFLPSDTSLTGCCRPAELDHAGDIDYVAKIANKEVVEEIRIETERLMFLQSRGKNTTFVQ